MKGIKEITCVICSGTGEVDNGDEWCGHVIENCDCCRGKGMVNVYKGMYIEGE
jgi:hypothetical protein